MYLSSPRSLAGQRGGAGFDRLEPGEGVVGGEGGVGANGEQAKADLLVYLARRERVGGGRSAVDSETAVEALIGGGVPVGIGRGGVAHELRRSEAERLAGLIEGGEGRRSGFDGELRGRRRPWRRRWCSGVWGRGTGERACGIECRGLPGAAARERIEAGAML